MTPPRSVPGWQAALGHPCRALPPLGGEQVRSGLGLAVPLALLPEVGALGLDGLGGGEQGGGWQHLYLEL